MVDHGIPGTCGFEYVLYAVGAGELCQYVVGGVVADLDHGIEHIRDFLFLDLAVGNRIIDRRKTHEFHHAAGIVAGGIQGQDVAGLQVLVINGNEFIGGCAGQVCTGSVRILDQVHQRLLEQDGVLAHDYFRQAGVLCDTGQFCGRIINPPRCPAAGQERQDKCGAQCLSDCLWLVSHFITPSGSVRLSCSHLAQKAAGPVQPGSGSAVDLVCISQSACRSSSLTASRS